MEVKQKTIVSEETKILICVKATKQRPKHKTYNERKYWGGGGAGEGKFVNLKVFKFIGAGNEAKMKHSSIFLSGHF